MLFVAASHQRGLDTRSKARRPIKVGIKGGSFGLESAIDRYPIRHECQTAHQKPGKCFRTMCSGWLPFNLRKINLPYVNMSFVSSFLNSSYLDAYKKNFPGLATSPTNIQSVCRKCNNFKSISRVSKMFSIDPKTDHWSY